MTSFEIFWRYLKAHGEKQEVYAEHLQIDRRTLGRWIKNGFSHSSMSPEYLCRASFRGYDRGFVKGFINYIKDRGYDPEINIINKDGSIDVDGFEAFFTAFLAGDIREVQKKQNFVLPAYYYDRLDDIDEIDKSFDGEKPTAHAIIGERGIGKSTLARAYANHAIQKKIFKHVIFVSFSNSIEDTVVKINSSDDNNGSFLGKLRMLRNLKKSGNTLIIIDNFDDPNLNKTLSESNPAYVSLLETECSLLFTSTSDLRQCYRIEDRVTRLKPLPTSELFQIFFKIRGEGGGSDEEACELIEKYLLGNTYLTVLCAELSKQGMSIREIIDAIKGSRADDTYYFSTQKDGERQDDKNLLEHFCCVLDNNIIINPDDTNARREMHGVLSILALMPIGGIPASEFDTVAYPYSKRKAFRRAISSLKNHNIVFESKGYVYLQPVVKEYLMRFIILLGEDTRYYLDSLAKKLVVDRYDDEMMRWVHISEAAYRAMMDEHTRRSARTRTLDLAEDYPDEDKVDESIDISILLGVRITACYSAVNLFSKAHEYAVELFPKFKLLTQGQKQPFDMLTVATCYNIVGFALIHSDQASLAKSMRAAFDCIESGIGYAERAKDMDYDAISIRVVLSKLQGTFAAYYIKKKEYATALEYHTRALREREQLITEDPDCDKYRNMLAFTYRGIGTDHFYLSRISDEVENLKLSYINNLKSLEIFEELYGSERLEAVEGAVRLIGTALRLMDIVSSDELCVLIGLSEDELLDSMYVRMRSIFSFYATCGLSLNGEMEDSLKKLVALTEKTVARGRFTEKESAFNAWVIESVKNISTASPACLEILPKLDV